MQQKENNNYLSNNSFLAIGNSLPLNPYFYWIILLKYKKQFLFIPLLLGFLSLLIWKSIDPIYQSKSSIIVDEQKTNIIQIDEVYNNTLTGNDDFINTQVQILKSQQLINRAISNEEFLKEVKKLIKPGELNFFQKLLKIVRPEYKKIEISSIDLENIYKDSFSVNNIRGTKIISIDSKTTSPELSKIFLDNLLQTYLEYDVDQKIEMTTYANSKITERLKELKDNLEKSELKLQDYKQENKLIDLGDIKDLKSEEIKSLSSRILKAEKELQEIQNDIQQVKLADGDIEELMSLGVIRDQAEVQNVKSELDANTNNIEALKLVYKESHPKLNKALKTQKSIEEKLQEIVADNINFFALEMANLQNFIDLSENELEIARQELQDLELKDIEMQKYLRDVALNERIYNSFLERLKETTEAKELQTPNAKILDYPDINEKPVSPHILQNTILTFLISFLALFSLATYFETFRSEIREPKDIENLGLNVLNIIPKVEEKKGYHIPLNFIEKNSGKFVESIKMVNTTLLAQEPNAKVIMLTSPLPGEGKTTLSLNIALELAEMNKVLFIETDLKKPSLKNIFNLENQLGLTDLFQSDITFSNSLFNIGSSNLDILSAGHKSYNKVIDFKKLNEFIEFLRDYYDYIVLDTAPILPIADTLKTLRLADVILLISKSDTSRVGSVVNAKRKIENITDKKIYSILNYFDTENMNEYNYYNYGKYYKSYYSYS